MDTSDLVFIVLAFLVVFFVFPMEIGSAAGKVVTGYREQIGKSNDTR